MNNLHIYSQGEWHGDAYIVGSTTALQRLRDAIERALSEGGGSATASVNDGEGFDTHVVRVDNPEEFDKLAVPYINELAKAPADAKGPWDMKLVHKLSQECHDYRRRKKDNHHHYDIGGEG